MNFKKIISSIALILIFTFVLAGCEQSKTTQQTTNSSNQMSKAKISADKIEVIHFHATQQCWSCITVGEYALKTIQERFPQEYKNGIITYKDINGELLENRDIVVKYQAGGSSLFVNAIANGKDNIEEDVTVWRLVSDEKKFKDYFENKLNTLLNK